MLRDVTRQDISVTVLGHKLSMPICVSPTAYQGMAHPDGELATVRGKLTGVLRNLLPSECFILSSALLVDAWFVVNSALDF